MKLAKKLENVTGEPQELFQWEQDFIDLTN